MKCPLCGSTDIEVDESAGHAACVQCGTVLEENTIVSSVEFQESGDRSHVVGQFVSATCSKTYGSTARGVGRYGFARESREATLANARRVISQVAASLRLPLFYTERAHRLYSLALQRNFIYGRRQLHVVAACLYIVCRQEKSPQLLIDFSDSLRVNVYELGKIFLEFTRILSLKLPIIDPSLYIHRFAARFEFGDKLGLVTTTALRTVTRFKKDWITTGRRPDGICAAALLIAARSHGFDREVAEISTYFPISGETIKKRLLEFRATPTAQLTLEQFLNIEMEEEFDPPAFMKHQFCRAKATGKPLHLDFIGTNEQKETKIIREEDSEEEEEEEEGVVPVMIDGIEVKVPIPFRDTKKKKTMSQRKKFRNHARRELYHDIFRQVKGTTDRDNGDDDDGDMNVTDNIKRGNSYTKLDQEEWEVLHNSGKPGWGGGGGRSHSHSSNLGTPLTTSVSDSDDDEDNNNNNIIDEEVDDNEEERKSGNGKGKDSNNGFSSKRCSESEFIISMPSTTAKLKHKKLSIPVLEKKEANGGGEGGGGEEEVEEAAAPIIEFDPSEVNNFILTEEESSTRSVIWEKLHRPFLDDRDRRRKERERELGISGGTVNEDGTVVDNKDFHGDDSKGKSKRGRKRGRVAGGAGTGNGKGTTGDVKELSGSGRASKKINYEALEGVFDKFGDFLPPKKLHLNSETMVDFSKGNNSISLSGGVNNTTSSSSSHMSIKDISEYEEVTENEPFPVQRKPVKMIVGGFGAGGRGEGYASKGTLSSSNTSSLKTNVSKHPQATDILSSELSTSNSSIVRPQLGEEDANAISLNSDIVTTATATATGGVVDEEADEVDEDEQEDLVYENDGGGGGGYLEDYAEDDDYGYY